MAASQFVKFINARITNGTKLLRMDLWIDRECGRIISEPGVDATASNVDIIDLRGRIIAPGFIDIQITGAFGFDFSGLNPNATIKDFEDGLRMTNKLLVQTGTTSYCPTLTSQFAPTYHKVSWQSP